MRIGRADRPRAGGAGAACARPRPLSGPSAGPGRRARAAGIMKYGRLWWLYLAAGTIATGVNLLLPADSLAYNATYNVVGAVSGLAILVAVRLHRPRRAAVWYWFGAGQLVWVAGDLVYEYYQYG